MEKYILIGIACTIGVVIAVGAIIFLIGVIRRIYEEMESRERKAETILGDRETYLKREMFEELAYIEKYKKELEQGKWPREMNQKFEYAEPKSKGFICEVSEEGLIFKPRKRFLKLKDCFKQKQKPNEKEKGKQPDPKNGENKKDNDNNKQ
jgi:nitrogen fixation-related uncharacterized protein